MFIQQTQTSENYATPLPVGTTQKTTQSCDKNNLIWKIRGNPLPESCVGLSITLCTELIVEKHIKATMFAHQSQKSEIYTAQLPFGSTIKTQSCDKNKFI